MRGDLPAGTVTFLFTDIEGSTRLLEEVGEDRYVEVLAEHRATLRTSFGAGGGVEVDTQGDAFFYAFADPKAAIAAAGRAQVALASGPVAVRMGLHTGRPRLTDEGYAGREVHRAARIAAAAHGGQVVISKETRELVGEAFSLLDLGEHRVKDFAEPVWIFQLGTERFPPLKTISNTNLPRPASSFVGREREVEEVAGMLRDGTRLLTLTGPGGSGKTRLSIEAASELVPDFRNGVFWVGLASIRDPALVPETIAQTLGAKDGAANHIGERDVLLLLDNFEQVVDAAPGLADLVEACPNLRVLVTSRELLRVRGEVEFAVPPLAETEAIELFCARSGLERDETIAALCRGLDNLPLAVELAAARASVLSPDQILERLAKRLDLFKGGRDADARQRTLRATIEWSHDLLDEDERTLFARLAVFRGGCTLEAAEEVAGADIDTLQSLVDKSLVRRTGDRFWMLETIREFAIERLEASVGARGLRRRHADHFLALGEEAEPYLRGDSREWADRLQGEHDNLRAAFDFFESDRNTERVLRLGGAIARFWYMKGHFVEGERRLSAALAADDRPTPVRAKALLGASVMAINLGDLAAARRRAGKALELTRALGDAWGVAYATMMCGNAANELGDLAAARPLFEESAGLFLDIGDEHYALISNVNLAMVLEDLGEVGAARDMFEDVLRRARAAGKERLTAYALAQVAMLVRNEGRLVEAARMLREAIGVNHDSGDPLYVALDLGRLASVLARQERSETGARLLGASLGLSERLGVRVPGWAEDRNLETRGILVTQLGEEALARFEEEGRRMTDDDAVALALESSG